VLGAGLILEKVNNDDVTYALMHFTGIAFSRCYYFPNMVLSILEKLQWINIWVENLNLVVDVLVRG
jgi:hypothetical protein